MPRRKYYYVSIIDGRRKGLLAGPYTSLAEAESKVAEVWKMAEEADPYLAAFAGFGAAGSDHRFPTFFGTV